MVSLQACDVQILLDSAMHDLFVKMQNPDHCLFQLQPSERSTTNSLRERGHNFKFSKKFHQVDTNNYKSVLMKASDVKPKRR